MALNSTQQLEQAPLETTEQLAYTLLETARIRCERLRPTWDEDSELHRVRRELGLAGYHASSEIEEETRRRCLALAHSEAVMPRSTEIRSVTQTIFEESLAALDTLIGALSEEPLDHLEMARWHTMSASETLDEYLLVLGL